MILRRIDEELLGTRKTVVSWRETNKEIELSRLNRIKFSINVFSRDKLNVNQCSYR